MRQHKSLTCLALMTLVSFWCICTGGCRDNRIHSRDREITFNESQAIGTLLDKFGGVAEFSTGRDAKYGNMPNGGLFIEMHHKDFVLLDSQRTMPLLASYSAKLFTLELSDDELNKTDIIRIRYTRESNHYGFDSVYDFTANDFRQFDRASGMVVKLINLFKEGNLDDCAQHYSSDPNEISRVKRVLSDIRDRFGPEYSSTVWCITGFERAGDTLAEVYQISPEDAIASKLRVYVRQEFLVDGDSLRICSIEFVE